MKVPNIDDMTRDPEGESRLSLPVSALSRTGDSLQAPFDRGASQFGEGIFTKRPISHDEATEVANRLINSHFHQEPHARASIPARPDYDDDLLILAYIHQQRAREPAPIGAPSEAANG